MDLNLIRLFIAVAESKNLSDTALRTGMTRSNVSRRLALMEKHYGTQLLRRTTRYMELTQAGRILYEHALQARNTLENAQLQIERLHNTISGEIRVRIPTGLGHFHLKPLILDFCKANPNLNVKVIINDQVLDLVAAKVDLAIHITSAPLEDHVATRVCKIDWGLFAAPQYLQRVNGALAQPHDIKKFKLITPLNLPARLEFTCRTTANITLVQSEAFIQSGDYQFLFNAAQSGLGIALLPYYAVANAVRVGKLVQVLSDQTVKGVGDALYIVRASNRQPSAASIALLEMLVTSIQSLHTQWSLDLQSNVLTAYEIDEYVKDKAE